MLDVEITITTTFDDPATLDQWAMSCATWLAEGVVSHSERRVRVVAGQLHLDALERFRVQLDDERILAPDGVTITAKTTL